jgi:NOL1/NOP2/sun family putative RNA methylase
MSQDKEQLFKEKLQKIYPSSFSKIIETHYSAKSKTFRVNTLKNDIDSVINSLENQGFEIRQAATQNAFICLNSKNNIMLSRTNEVLNSEIYIQELSSMLPAIVLSPKENESIIDLCAAPGSKTTQIASLTDNKAEIIAVEKNRSRFFRMKDIISNANATNVKFILDDSKNLIYKYDFSDKFDKVLLDAPCSNEAGINLKDKEVLKFWNKKKAESLSKLQKGLIINAFGMLKKGGVLVYSTCTYSIEENEEVIDWLIKKVGENNIEILKFDLPIDNYVPGKTAWGKKIFNKALINTVRIIPNLYYNGFFIAKIRKA